MTRPTIYIIFFNSKDYESKETKAKPAFPQPYSCYVPNTEINFVGTTSHHCLEQKKTTMRGATSIVQSYGENLEISAQVDPPAPLEQLLDPPTVLARYTAASMLIGIFAVWGKYSFVGEKNFDANAIHDYRVPLVLTVGYLVSLPLLRLFSERYLSKNVDVKLLLRESMIIYNAAQVLLNCWMVFTILQALLFRGHPFIGDLHTVSTGATYAVWIHYTDKYLEFLDTYFMVLRGKMDQVSLPWLLRVEQIYISARFGLTISTCAFYRFHFFTFITTQRLHGLGGRL